MTDPLLSVLAEWPGRWRRPALAEALSGELSADRPTTLADAAKHVLAGLADPLTTAQAVERLVEQGNFALVDEFLAQNVAEGAVLQDADPVDPVRVRESLTAARLAASAETERELALLGERASRVGLAPPDLPDLLDEVELCRSRAEDALAREESERIVPAENALRNRLEQRLAELPDAAVPRQAVKDCLAAGEFHAAEHLLESTDVDLEGAGPAAVPRPPLWYPAMGGQLDDILLHYTDEARARADHGRRLFTDIGDTGLDTIRTMRALHERPDCTTVGAFAGALTQLLGGGVRFPVTERDGGFLTRFTGLNDSRLPETSLDRGAGVVLWVAEQEILPPDDLARPLIWFRTTGPQHKPGEHPKGVAVLTATDLLLLFVRTSGGTPDPATRRVNLMRALVPQLGLGHAFDPHQGIVLGRSVLPRTGLVWLLDLLAVSAQAAVVDALNYETEAHPMVLPRLLDELLSQLTKSHRLTLAALTAVRNRGVRDDLRALLTVPLRSSERAVLGMAYALHRDAPFAASDLAADVSFFDVPPESVVETVRRLDVEAALAELGERQLLRADADGWRTLRSGLGRMLAEEAEELARSSLRAVLVTVAQAEAHARVILTDKAMTVIGHRNDNRVASILTDLDRLEPFLPTEEGKVLARLRSRAEQFRSEHYQHVVTDFLRSPEPGDLVALAQEVSRSVQHEYGERISVWPAEQSLMVFGMQAYIRIALENLLMNAAQALRTLDDETGGDDSTDRRIVVRLSCVDRVSEGEPVLWCVLDVEDGGPGLTEKERGALRAGSGFSRNGSRGSGLALAREMVQECRGTIEILERSELGGAHVRVWLPRA